MRHRAEMTVKVTHIQRGNFFLLVFRVEVIEEAMPYSLH
jgi:hypothetical protein